MTLRRISLFAATLMTVMATGWGRVLAAVDYAFRVVLETIAGPARPPFSFDSPAAAGHAPSYEAPPQHFIRHEAGAVQRGSHRKI